MKILLLTSIAAIVACAATAALAKPVKYRCEDGSTLAAQFRNKPSGPGSVVLSFGGGGPRMTLPQVLSADGGRYAADGTEFWIKGKGATLTRAGGSTTCSTH